MARMPTDWEKEQSDKEHEILRNKRIKYEEEFKEKHLDALTQIFQISAIAALGYVLGLILEHMLSHDDTHKAKKQSTCLHDMKF